MERHLRARLSSVLDYAALAVDVLLGDDVEAAETDRPEGRKVASETAILLLVASRADDGSLAARIAALAQRLAPHARSHRVRRAVAAAPSRAPWLGLAHVVLDRLGLPDGDFDRLLRATLASPWAAACEREPHRVLDARWVTRLLDGGPVRHDDTAPLSVLGLGVDLLTGSVDDLYALTHALFYATDFGALPVAPGRPPQAVLDDVEGGLAVAFDADDLDLAGELLMAPALLRVPWSVSTTLAWYVFDGLWETHGCVPSPGFDVAAHARADAAERSRIVLRDTYHTMHVAGLLCATLLATGHLPPAPPTGVVPDPDAERLLAALARDRSRAWIQQLASAGAGFRAAALPLALDVTARRLVRTLDVDGLVEVVATAITRGHSGRSLSTQTTGLLRRLLATAR